MIRSFVAALSILFITTTIVNAQTPKPKFIAGGVVNGKARNLVKPEYPAAARAVGACGAVNIQVMIDFDGSISEASAVSGHPLLRAAAVAAAKQSTFFPTLLSGEPVRISGIIVYNFACRMHPLSIGYELARVERGVREVRDESIASSLRSDWTEVQDDLKALRDEIAKLNAPVKMKDSRPDGSAAAVSASPNESGDPGKVREIARGLIEKIESAYESDDDALWKFRIGVRIARVVEDSSDPVRYSVAVRELQEFFGTAPIADSDQALGQIREFIQFAKSVQPATDSKPSLIEKASGVLK